MTTSHFARLRPVTNLSRFGQSRSPATPTRIGTPGDGGGAGSANRNLSGALIVFVGPDGSGKSTLVRALSEYAGWKHPTINFRPRRVDRMMRPGVNRRTHNSAAPHSTKTRSKYGAAGKAIFIWLDLLTVMVDQRRAWRAGEPLIVERYAYDLIADRSRLGLNTADSRLLVWLARVAPRPVVIVCCTGDPVIMHARKAELPIDEIERQAALWRSLARVSLPIYFVDTTTGTVDENVQQVLGFLYA